MIFFLILSFILKRLIVSYYRFFLFVEFLQELFVLLDGLSFSLLFFLLCRLLGNDLGSGNASHLVKGAWLEPAVGYLELTFDLLPEGVHVVDRENELEANILIVFFGECPAFILSNIVAIKAVLQRERMRDLELFPCHNSRSAYLIGLNSESAIFVVKHVCLLGEDSWKQPDDGPTEESAICSSIATIKERIVLFRMAVQIAKDPDMALVFFFDSLHEFLDRAYLWMEIFFGVYPLTIQVNASEGISIVAAYNSIWIHDWYEYECVESPEVFGLSIVRCEEIVNASKYLAPGRFP